MNQPTPPEPVTAATATPPLSTTPAESSSPPEPAPTESSAPPPRLITTPRDTPVKLITDQAGLQAFIAALDPTAPVAVDTERAQGFRYSSKAYLIQFRQAACGTYLIDPVALAPAGELADLSALSHALAGCEWVLHAASQDLPCLAEVGLVPQHLFDTELAGRLLNIERVSLSPMLTHYLGLELAKAHSADDWSRRPLPEAWLVYAALDVDFLIELRDAVAADLAAAGKMAWAEQEFTDALARFAISPAADPQRWRHTKGLGRLRQPRQLALARNLWQVRDNLARQVDTAPGRILNDAALVEAVTTLAKLSPAQVPGALATLDGFTGPLAKRRRRLWAEAVTEALQEDADSLPQRRRKQTTPLPRLWEQANPSAAKRWAAARPAILALAEANNLPPENLMTVSTLADVLWPDDLDTSPAGLRQALAAAQARPWQCDLIVPVLADALQNIETP